MCKNYFRPNRKYGRTVGSELGFGPIRTIFSFTSGMKEARVLFRKHYSLPPVSQNLQNPWRTVSERTLSLFFVFNFYFLIFIIGLLSDCSNGSVVSSSGGYGGGCFAAPSSSDRGTGRNLLSLSLFLVAGKIMRKTVLIWIFVLLGCLVSNKKTCTGIRWVGFLFIYLFIFKFI